VILGYEDVDTTLSRTVGIAPLEPIEVTWVDLEDVESPADDLRDQGVAKGAARFSRGEGIWTGPDGVSFAATSGGMNQRGQIWRYVPSPFEGRSREAEHPGTIELLVEPNDVEILDMADNIAVAPWGDLLICEDGREGNFLRGLTPEGILYPIAFNAMNDSEFAGSCVSPDGTTLFVNIQRPGLTLAITGPWA
jgi:secreted PhoX family phosphatase